MSDFAEWRPCRVCGLPVALPQRVHDECASPSPDEGRVRVGTKGYVYYLKPDDLIDCVVREIRVSPDDGQLYAACDDGSGDTRWFRLDEIHTR